MITLSSIERAIEQLEKAGWPTHIRDREAAVAALIDKIRRAPSTSALDRQKARTLVARLRAIGQVQQAGKKRARETPPER